MNEALTFRSHILSDLSSSSDVSLVKDNGLNRSLNSCACSSSFNTPNNNNISSTPLSSSTSSSSSGDCERLKRNKSFLNAQRQLRGVLDTLLADADCEEDSEEDDKEYNYEDENYNYYPSEEYDKIDNKRNDKNRNNIINQTIPFSSNSQMKNISSSSHSHNPKDFSSSETTYINSKHYSPLVAERVALANQRLEEQRTQLLLQYVFASASFAKNSMKNING